MVHNSKSTGRKIKTKSILFMARELENTINEQLETFKELGKATQNPTETEENIQMYHRAMEKIAQDMEPVISLIAIQAPEMYKLLVIMKDK